MLPRFWDEGFPGLRVQKDHQKCHLQPMSHQRLQREDADSPQSLSLAPSPFRGDCEAELARARYIVKRFSIQGG